MALDASKETFSGGTGHRSEPLEAGNYIARLVQVIDLGVQPQRPFQGQEKPPAHEIMLTYELGTEFLKDENGEDMEDKPRYISESIPLHNLKADKAKSTKRAKIFDPSNKLNGNFPKMLNAPCTVTIVQNPKKGTDIIYNNVSNVTPPMKGFPVPELKNPPKFFDLDEPDMEIFGSLPEWIQDKIKSCLNFSETPLAHILSSAPVTKVEEKKDPEPVVEGEDGSDPWD